jgi:redox-sensitive bicupin YhaK (pirin superfamily)
VLQGPRERHDRHADRLRVEGEKNGASCWIGERNPDGLRQRIGRYVYPVLLELRPDQGEDSVEGLDVRRCHAHDLKCTPLGARGFSVSPPEGWSAVLTTQPSMRITLSNMAYTSVDPAVEQPSARRGARTVAGVFPRTPFHWVGNGFRVSSYFPRPSLPAERVSPFLLMDYGPPNEFAPLAQGQRGVGWHPHRGFETVTVAWEGSVAHRDSAGNAGIIGPGDVQWMTAAAGILHEEYHEREFTRRGGRMHMMQLWVNLPKKHKMAAPRYQPLTAKDIPVVTLAEGAGTVRVIAGELYGARGPARTFSPVTLLDVLLTAKGKLTVALPPEHNALAIVTSGPVSVDGERAGAGELILFENDGERLELVALEDAHVLVLGGEPLDEPIVQYGPFVMNSRQEIVDAIEDFEAGKFGRIPE